MRFFDLHCDTIGECCKQNLPLADNDKLHITLKKAACFKEYCQLFAVFIPDELSLGEAVEYFDKVSKYFYNELEKNSEVISMFGSKNSTPIKALLTVEGGSATGGTVDGVKRLRDAGVRVMTLTWNQNNEIAAGAFSDGGLTVRGKEIIREMEKVGIIADVSHLNRQSFFEVAKFSRKPIIATHSNADTVDNFAARKRNLTDEQIIILRDKKGLIGLNFCEDFIRYNGSTGVDALYRQIEYFLNLGCEDVLAIGSDYDGCPVNDCFNGIEKIPDVYSELIKMGLPKHILEKLFFENANTFFMQHLHN